MTDAKKLAELMIAFKQASPRTMLLNRDIIREGLLAVLEIVGREHAQQILQTARQAYANGVRDSQALTDLGF